MNYRRETGSPTEIRTRIHSLGNWRPVQLDDRAVMVGATGLEPASPEVETPRIVQLCYAPKMVVPPGLEPGFYAPEAYALSSWTTGPKTLVLAG